MNTPRLSPALCSTFALLSLCAFGVSATAPVENPVGGFLFTPPPPPPSGAPAVTPVNSLNGTYTDSSYLGGEVTVTTDEAGKVTVVGGVAGFTDNKGNRTLTRTAFVKTVNGVPMLTASASVSGTDSYYEGSEDDTKVTGSGKISIPLVPPGSLQNGQVPVTVMNSFSGSSTTRDENNKPVKTPDNAKPGMDTILLDKTQVENITSTSWSMKLFLIEELVKGKLVVKAALELIKPDGEITFFPYRTVKFSATNGYSFVFSRGQEYISSGVPKPPVNGKPVIDKKSQVGFSKLLFKKVFDVNNVPSFEPAAGGVSYKFLGQKGFGQVFNFEISPIAF